MVFDHHQAALSVSQVDAAGGVGQNRGANAHAGKTRA